MPTVHSALVWGSGSSGSQHRAKAQRQQRSPHVWCIAICVQIGIDLQYIYLSLSNLSNSSMSICPSESNLLLYLTYSLARLHHSTSIYLLNYLCTCHSVGRPIHLPCIYLPICQSINVSVHLTPLRLRPTCLPASAST